MKFKMVVLLLWIAAVMTACTKTTVGDGDRAITLDKVVESIQAEGPVLTAKGQDDNGALNGVKPHLFDIADAADSDHPESIYVYLFDSEQELKKGIENQQYSVTELTALKNYERDNVLVVYFAKGGKLEKFGGKIEAAMQKL